MPIPTVWRSEYRINTSVFSGTNEFDAEIGALANGRFAMTWVSNDSITLDADARFTIRLANGDAVSTSFGDEIMSGNGAIDEFRAAAAGLPDGRIVFTWDEEAAVGGEQDVYAEVRNADGGTFTDRFEITQPSGVATDDQDVPTVLGLSNGNLMVAYRDTQPATDTIRVRPYDIAGVLQGGNTISSTAATDSLFNRPQMAELQNGNVVVTWSSGPVGASQQKFGIRAPSGLPVLVETDINPEDAVNEAVAGDVVALADGNFVVIFDRPDDASDVQGRLFDQNGNPLGARFDIGIGFGFSPAATALQDGRFMVVFDTGNDIRGRMMRADGTPDGNQFVIDGAAGSQSDPAIATLADGRVVVSWESDQLGTFDVFAEIYDPREEGLNRSATSFNDDWIGTGFIDRVYMGAGNDTIDGDDGNDDLRGETGNDTLIGGEGDDSLDGGSGGDTMRGGNGNDTYYVNQSSDVTDETGGSGIETVRSTISHTLAADIEKLILLGTAANGTGNALVNFIDGNASANVLDGAVGADRLTGKGGNDLYFVDSSGDVIFETIAGAAGGTDAVSSSVNHTLATNVENLVITAAAGQINGTGNSLANAIAGGNGNNFIDGKEGNDTLTGNLGIDNFLFTTALSAATNTDTITDFTVADDTLRLDDAIFTTLATGFLAAAAFHTGASAADAGDRIIYNSATGEVFYDSDGLGGVAQVRFANVGVGLALTAADVFVF